MIYPIFHIFLSYCLINYKLSFQHTHTHTHTYIYIVNKISPAQIMQRAILNKSWRQYPTRHQLYGHLPPITKTIQVRRTRHAGHCWRSRDELISDVLLWTPTHGRAKAGRPARTYIQQLCEDTGCCPEDLPEAMNDREKWRERVRDIHATSTTWWWWWLLHKDRNLDLSLEMWMLLILDISDLSWLVTQWDMPRFQRNSSPINLASSKVRTSENFKLRMEVSR